MALSQDELIEKAARAMRNRWSMQTPPTEENYADAAAVARHGLLADPDTGDLRSRLRAVLSDPMLDEAMMLDAINAILDEPTSEVGQSRELLGRWVRQVWVRWASEQDDPKPSWLAPWEELDDGQREVDMRIGETLYGMGQASADPKRLFAEYVYRVVDRDGVPYASGNSIKSVKTYSKLSTARRIASDQNHYAARLRSHGHHEDRAPYRVQRAAVIWEDASDD